MNKVTLITSAVLLLSASCETSEMSRIRSKHLIASHELGRVTLRHDGSSFAVQQGKESYKVASYDTDPLLRQLTKRNLASFLRNGRIGVHKLSDGSFALSSHVKGLGGGVLGAAAGCWLGKTLVYGVVQTAIWGTGALVSAFATPVVGGIVVCTLQGVMAVPTEITSNYVAIAGGIALGTATGPV